MTKEWLNIHRAMVIPTSEITGVHGIRDVDGTYHVRIIRKTPVIDFVCKDKEDAADFYKSVLKSCSVVSLKSFKYGE